MKKLLIILLLLISNVEIFSQNTKIDSICLSTRAFDLIMKDVKKGDSLKLRYKELQLKTIDFSNAVIQLAKKNDSLDKREVLNNFKIKELNTELKSVKLRKGLSVFEGVLIGFTALGIGLAI